MKKEVFVSTSCIKINDLEKNITFLASHGIKNIELSGGCIYQRNILSRLKKLKKRHSLKFLVHNYFPPPKKNFVLNLASCNDKIYFQTIDFYKKTLDLCNKLNIKYYGIHAGFLVDIKNSELGKKIKKKNLFPKKKSIKRLINGYNLLKKYNKNKVKIFLENNVITKKNLKEYKANPLLLTSYSDYKHLSKNFKIELLLDLAHLKVSSKTLKKKFDTEINKFAPFIKYAHVSSNNSLKDSNLSITRDKNIIDGIKKLRNLRLITLEVYQDIKSILESKKLCEQILSND